LGNMKQQYLQRPDASAAPIDISTPEGWHWSRSFYWHKRLVTN
jgi:hypothetical protein